MATTRKGWRPITVQSERYRWTVRRGAKSWGDSMKFIVESSLGALLIVNLNRPRLDDYYWLKGSDELRPITPAEVVQEITNALSNGWNPHLKSKPFTHRANT